MNDWLQNFEEIPKIPDEIAVVDLETTGSSLDVSKPSTIDSKIVQIGITVHDFKNNVQKQYGININDHLTEIDKDSWIFLKSDKNQNPLDFDKFISTGEDIHNHWDTIQGFLNLPITAFNSNFDLSILRFRGFEIPRPLPCLMRSYAEKHSPITDASFRGKKSTKKIIPKEIVWDEDLIWNQTPLINSNAKSCYTDLIGKEPKQSHNATDDSEHETEILVKMFNTNGYSPLHCDLINVFREDTSYQIRFFRNLLNRNFIDELDESDKKRLEQLFISDVYLLHINKFDDSNKYNKLITNTSNSTKQQVHQIFWNELSNRYEKTIKELIRDLRILANKSQQHKYNELINEELEQIDKKWDDIIPKYF